MGLKVKTQHGREDTYPKGNWVEYDNGALVIKDNKDGVIQAVYAPGNWSNVSNTEDGPDTTTRQTLHDAALEGAKGLNQSCDKSPTCIKAKGHTEACFPGEKCGGGK